LAFTHRGIRYKFLMSPFGLSYIPASFQRYITNVLKDLPGFGTQIFVYIDNIIVLSHGDKELHRNLLQMIVDHLTDHNVTTNPNKCKLFKKELETLGFLITNDSLKISEKTQTKIRLMKVPSTGKEIRSFMGLANYCRKFISNYAEIAFLLERIRGKKEIF
jgi:hypothetical protein